MLLYSWTENEFWGFTQNGCYGNHSEPLEDLFDSTDANNPCPFTKQDLIFKQAYLVGFCFVLFNKLKFWQLVLAFSALYRLYLEITLFCTKPSEQIVYCHVTDVKMLKKIVYWITTLLVFDYPKSQEFQSRNVSAKSAGSKVVWKIRYSLQAKRPMRKQRTILEHDTRTQRELGKLP